MSSKKNEIPSPPGFERCFAKISPTGGWSSLGKRRSLRKRATQNFFGLTNSHLSPRPHDQGLRRGRGRPRKQRSDESSLSQPLRRGRGHPRKKRSDAPTNSPEVPPPPVPPAESNGSLPERVLMSTNVPELIPQISVPPLGSTSAMPFLIPCDEKEELRETKLKLTPLSRLIEEKETHASTNGSSFQMHEESKKVFTDQVKSMLVSQLTSGTTTSVDDMVTFANRAFTTLNLFGADYGPLYKDVKDFITYNFDLLIADRKLDILSVSELEKKLGAVIRGNDIKDEKCLKDDEQKYRAAYRIAQAEVEKLGTQLKAARVAQMEIEQLKNEALQGIESSTQRLMSYK